MRDLYEILGVSRDASEEDVKRAYRRRARQLHPDTGGDQEEFKELTAAYEVLRNPTARTNYDRYGDPRGPGGAAGGDPFAGFGDLSDLIDAFFGGSFGGGRPDFGGGDFGGGDFGGGDFGGGGFGGGRATRRAGRQGGRDAIIDVNLTLEEAAAGVRRDLEVTVARTCEQCDGSGAGPGSREVTCPTCHGQGAVQQVSRSVFGQMLTTTPCPTCRGEGRRLSEPCRGCGGEGRRQLTETVTVDVPPGVDDGTRLRVAGRGEAGRKGGSTGDLYVRVRVRPHPIFTREGNDLHCELGLTLAQAALGGDLKVPTLYGEETLTVPPGTQTGSVLTLRRQGMPKLSGGGARGNLYVHCRVETPRNLDAEQAELLRQFAARRGEELAEPHRTPRGFFDRIRDAFGA